MRSYLIVSLLLTNVVSSCQTQNKYSEQLATVDALIHALYAYDTTKVSTITGVNPENIGEDKESYRFKLEAAKKMLQKNGLPREEDLNVKEYPQNSPDLIDVTTTFKQSGQSITIRFVKFLPPTKIAFFRLDGPFLMDRTIAPDSKN